MASLHRISLTPLFRTESAVRHIPDVRSAVSQGHIAALTVMRGLAAWWVALYHFRQLLPDSAPIILMEILDHGYLAVDFFFVLSGFIIAHRYFLEFYVWTINSYKYFIALRLARIYPLHILMLILFLANPIAILLFSSSGQIGQRYNAEYFFMSIFLAQNWGFTNYLAWNIPAWSISTEICAYISFPFMVMFLRPALGTIHGCIAALMAAWALCIGIFVSAGADLAGNIADFGLPRCLVQFLMGVCLSRLALHLVHRHRLADMLFLGSFSTLTLWIIHGGLPDFVVVPLCWAGIVLGLSMQGAASRFFSSSQIAFIVGEISYSTYLSHYFILDWVKFLLVRNGIPPVLIFSVAVLATAIASFVLFNTVEAPGRDWFRRRIRRG